MQFKHIRGTPYHSRTNGAMERLIRTFIAKYLAERRDSEDKVGCLTRVLMSLRCTEHSTTKRSPSELMLGRKIQGVLEKIRPEVSKEMEASKYNQKKHHDRRTREKNFDENDNVWSYSNTAGEYQPGTIVSKSGPLSYKVAVENKIEPKHADHLRSREINEGSNNSTKEICPFITNDETGVKKSLLEATPDSRSEETEENQNQSPILRRSARIKNFPPIRYYE